MPDLTSPFSSLPVTDPVLIFALAMIIFVAVPPLAERVRVPGIVGLIVAGTVVGPNALNLLARGQTIVLLGTVGLLYLMFMVGLELDIHDFNRYRNRSVVFGSITFLIPQAIGTAVGLAFNYPISSSLLLGAVFASHTVLAYPIASGLGIVKNLAVTTALGGTILTETLALLVLAVIAGSIGGTLNWMFWVTLVIALSIYVAAVLWGVPLLARWFFRTARSEGTIEFVFVMAVLFGVSFLAHSARVEPIIGALLVGLAMNRLIPENSQLMSRLHFMGNSFFIPFFLLSVGMLVDVRQLTTLDAWTIAIVLAVGVIVGKLAAAQATQRIFHYTVPEGWVIFGLSVPHASGTLAIVLVGFQMGVFDQTEVNGVVLTIMVTSLIGPWAVARFGRRVAIDEEQKPYEPRSAPQRILIPIANPATEEALLDLAMLLRDPTLDEPLYALMVVRDLEDRTEAQVAEAEQMLSHAVIYAAGAEVPVAPLTRVDQNIAAGIARGIAETRTSTVVVGWDGGRTPVGGIFGSVLDQLLEQTKQMVVVAKLGHALNTTRRLILVLPPLVQRHPGFFEAARATKLIASQLGIPILGLVVNADPAIFDELYDPLKPSASTTFERVDGWGDLLAQLRKRTQSDDLVVVISARRGTLPWHLRLERMPRQLAVLDPESFLMLFPAEADTPRREDVPAGILPHGLKPERIIYDLPAMPFDAALRRILECGFPERPERLEEVVVALMKSEREFSTEVRPGVVVPHARVEGIDEALLFLGTSRAGIAFPHAREPVKLIFVLLSPAERPAEHLKSLAEIARLMSRGEVVQGLLAGEHLIDGGQVGNGDRR